jgi:hypothetical protein
LIQNRTSHDLHSSRCAVEHERKRWLRADAHRFVRPDWRRFIKPGSELATFYDSVERKYRPDQPRVPAGVPEGGQWSSEGGGTLEPGAQEQQTSSDVQRILEKAKQLAARGYSIRYLQCLEICYPLLERPQPAGADFNMNDFHRCMAACMRRN